MNQPNSVDPPKINLADYFQRFSSKVLWHFTGYNKLPDDAFKILNSILESNTLKVGKDFEPVIMNTGEKRIGYSVSCACDIPFRDLRIHMLRYGQFGIAFHKHAAINEGHFNPVFYVHRGNALFLQAHELLKNLDPDAKPDSALFKYMMIIGSYAKVGDLNRIVEVNSDADSSQASNFYYEREWRTVFPWMFSDSSIAAIMMPQSYLNQFRNKWQNRFDAISLISSEMIETL
jgi:hypothetical protein